MLFSGLQITLQINGLLKFRSSGYDSDWNLDQDDCHYKEMPDLMSHFSPYNSIESIDEECANLLDYNNSNLHYDLKLNIPDSEVGMVFPLAVRPIFMDFPFV